MEAHYDKDYFDWQKSSGAFGGSIETIKFEEFISEDMNVLDFGCGGGYILKNLSCKNKIGIDINDVARKTAESFGIETYNSIMDAPNDWADCIISNHALEHVNNPHQTISALKEKLKPEGLIIFVVPNDTYTYKSDDINKHLYSWSPMNLGNLFASAGYKVIDSSHFHHRFPPYSKNLRRAFGSRVFHIACRVYGNLNKSRCSQVRCVAKKE